MFLVLDRAELLAEALVGPTYNILYYNILYILYYNILYIIYYNIIPYHDVLYYTVT